MVVPLVEAAAACSGMIPWGGVVYLSQPPSTTLLSHGQADPVDLHAFGRPCRTLRWYGAASWRLCTKALVHWRRRWPSFMCHCSPPYPIQQPLPQCMRWRLASPHPPSPPRCLVVGPVLWLSTSWTALSTHHSVAAEGVGASEASAGGLGGGQGGTTGAGALPSVAGILLHSSPLSHCRGLAPADR
jgi:hypothetical protein